MTELIIEQRYQNKQDKTRYLEVILDTDGDADPRKIQDNLGIMICSHQRYTLGDIQANSREELDENLSESVVKLPLFLMDHSGVSISTCDFNDKWDSGQVGFIYTTQEKIKEMYGDTKPTNEQLIQALKSEVKEYDDYIRGNVHGYREYKVDTCNMNHEHKTIEESCFGFIGDIADCGVLDNYNMDEWELVQNE